MALDKYMILRTVFILVAAVVLFMLISYYNTKQSTVASEKFFQDALASSATGASAGPIGPSSGAMMVPTPSGPAAPVAPTGDVAPAEDGENGDYRPVDFEVKQVPNDCFPKDRLTAEDLLPSDASSKWAQVNPAGQGDVKNVNFLTAGYSIGVNTVAGSMKNPNLQLRPDPRIEKKNWPIMNSSYTPDPFRRGFELDGSCA